MRTLMPRKQPEDGAEYASEMLTGDESSESSSESASEPIWMIWRSHSFKSIFLGRLRSSHTNFGLADLNEMNAMALLSAWHTVALWLSACVLMCEVLQKLLKGYVMWMQITLHNGHDVEIHVSVYLATLLRCWFVVLFYSDLARFCFWLIRDAWRPDAFEAYRRAVCGVGEVEMRSGSVFYDENGMPRGWPDDLSRFQRRLDKFWQIFIYFSFDIWPFIATTILLTIQGNRITGLSMCSGLTSHAGMVGLLHVAIFKFAWLVTDLLMKYRGLKEALRKGRGEDGDEDASMSEDGEGDIRSKDEALVATADGAVHHHRKRRISNRDEAFLFSESVTQAGQQMLTKRLQVANDLNICVPFCRFLNVVLPHLTYLSIIAAGIFTRRNSIVVFGLAFGLYHLGAGAMYVLMDHGALPTADKFLPSLNRGRLSSRMTRALQAWGEECCGLDYDTQLERRVIFTIMVALQTTLFAILRWHYYTAVCAALVLLQLMQLTVHCQVPWGWLVSGVEAVVYFLSTTFLALAFLPKRKMAIETVLFALAHQAGLARKTYYGMNGYKVVRLVITLLFVVLFIVLAVTMLAVDSQTEVGDTYTMLCDNCTYYQVPYVQQKYATGLACPAWFHLGNRVQKLSLSDFGLLSVIAYESEATINNALALFFPGWTLAHSKRVGDGAQYDWTTFFQVNSPLNQTTVFVVRGTSTALDALNDMIVWMPAAVMQGFNLMGPDMLAPVARAIADLSEIFGRLDDNNYAELQRYVVKTMKEDPDREYYITGHSLGGGLAKIVSLKAMLDGLELPAVTFMSPGLLATQYLVEGRTWDGDSSGEMTAAWLRDHELAVTVMPENDIVSRIDGQTGQVVPIGCESGSALQCHLMGMGLCEIFKECGSGRRDESINIPCGICPRAPCVDGVYEKDFSTRFGPEQLEKKEKAHKRQQRASSE